MAIMHPENIIRFNAYSEIKFFNACKEQLSDKFHVFYSLRWYTTNQEGIREDSECDFLIFNPDYGFLCIEVKGGSRISVEEGKWYLEDSYGGRFLNCSPYKQSEESMRFFKSYYETELETFYPGVYGHAVAFPNYPIASPITPDAPRELTIDSNDIKVLGRRITEIFRYFKTSRSGTTSFFSPDSQKKFINLINKRIAISIAAGALIEDKQKELIELNQTQDAIIDLLSHYPRAFIVGGAGTGKTWIGMKKVLRCVQSGGDALFLCYNKSLSKFVEETMNDKRVDCYTIDSFMYSRFGAKASYVSQLDGNKVYSDLFSNDFSGKKYDLIVVDEGQDFTEDWAYCVNLLLKKAASLYVLYDESQNIFNRNFGEKFFIDNPPFVLRYNIRNTANIYKAVREKTNLGLDTIANRIEGVDPECHTYTRKSQLISFIDSIINRLVNREGLSPSKIILLSDRRKDNSIFKDISIVGGIRIDEENDNNTIKFRTIQSFKGLESDIVIFVHHSYKNEPQTETIRSLIYTAWTRARFYLYALDYIESSQITE